MGHVVLEKQEAGTRAVRRVLARVDAVDPPIWRLGVLWYEEAYVVKD